MLEDVVKRIETRLKAVGKSAAKASREAGLSDDAIRNLRRRADDPNAGAGTQTIAALAPILGTTSSWLLEGIGDESVDDNIDRDPTVPVVGYVAAGSIASFFTDDVAFDEVPAPANAPDDTVAVEIRGDSLGTSFDGWFAFYNDIRNPVTADLIGKLCVVRTDDGRTFLKRLQRGSSPSTYHLVSERGEPIFDAHVEWAARVTQISPK